MPIVLERGDVVEFSDIGVPGLILGYVRLDLIVDSAAHVVLWGPSDPEPEPVSRIPRSLVRTTLRGPFVYRLEEDGEMHLLDLSQTNLGIPIRTYLRVLIARVLRLI